MNEKISGNLIIIGGAEDKRGKKEILKKVAEYINTKEDKMLIATIATEYPEKTYDDYKNINLIKTTNLLFFTGGD